MSFAKFPILVLDSAGWVWIVQAGVYQGKDKVQLEP